MIAVQMLAGQLTPESSWGSAGSRVLLLATYELGHQPLSLAWPQAALARAGLLAMVVDLSVEAFPAGAAAAADFVGIAVPMHTAMRLGVQAAERVRQLNPKSHICFYGLYAVLNAGYLLHPQAGGVPLADSVLGGEYEEPLVQLVTALRTGRDPTTVSGVSSRGHVVAPSVTRQGLPAPERSQLPPLSQYARYVDNGTSRLAGYVEASRGCLHTCRHCPVTPVYQGRFTVVPFDTVMADIRQQVRAGAGHITFGDPDFLNGPGHALKLARGLHAEFPDLSFDFTTKVEHILKHRRLIPEFHDLGARFIVSAFEATSDRVLKRLSKGHTVAELDAALAVARNAGLHIQPTWVPFTPWTTLADYTNLLAWIADRELITFVPAVQLSIRLLVPPGSALLDHADAGSWVGPLDAANFVYTWLHSDPAMDDLQKEISLLAEEVSASGATQVEAFTAITDLAYAKAGRPAPFLPLPTGTLPAPPRITEDWFC